MDNEFDNENDENDNDVDDNDDTPAGLRRAAKDGKAAKAELAAAKRELAMLKAGVDTSTKVGTLFAKAYDGDLDAAKIKAEWAEISGAIATPTTDTALPDTPDPVISDDERTSTATRAAVASGADVKPGPGDEDPRVTAANRAEQVIKDGGSREAGMAAAFMALCGGAAQGDERVIVPSPTFSV